MVSENVWSSSKRNRTRIHNSGLIGDPEGCARRKFHPCPIHFYNLINSEISAKRRNLHYIVFPKSDKVVHYRKDHYHKNKRLCGLRCTPQLHLEFLMNIVIVFEKWILGKASKLQATFNNTRTYKTTKLLIAVNGTFLL